MKTKIIFRLFLLLFLPSIFISCGNQPKDNATNDKLKGHISISGAFAMYPMTVKWAEEFQKKYPEVHIDVSAGGAGKGMADVLSGLVDIAMVSREINPEEISKGAWFVAAVKDAVIPTINSGNPVYKDLMHKGLQRQHFIDIFLHAKIKYWGELAKTNNKDKINVYTRSDACGAAEIWAKYLGSKQDYLKGIGIFGDPGISDAVKKDKYGIGYNNVIYAYDPKTKKIYDGLAVIPIDLNENGIIDSTENFYSTLDELMQAIKEEKYPSPPARELYFVTKGKPEKKIIIEFLKFVLNEGQKYVYESGYVCLSENKLKNELKKINE